MTSKRKFVIVVALGALLLPLGTPIASAETFVFQSGALTNLDPAGAKVNGGFTKFPTKAGMYIQQCVEPVGTARPATCSDANQLWVTATGEPQSSISTGPISMPVSGTISGRGTVIDCTKTQCGLFFRLDRTAGSDTSEDKFLPISFRAGTAAPILPADEITVTLNGKVLTRNVPSNLAYRAKAKVAATSKSGLPVTLSSLTADCTVANGVLTALKGSGQCALGHSTAGDATYAPSVANYPFILVPGAQKVAKLPKALKASSTRALPAETTFGSTISYKSLSKGCRVELNLVEVQGRGSCTLKMSAPAKAGMWEELSARVTLKITKTGR
jgi:hypothetical protein